MCVAIASHDTGVAYAALMFDKDDSDSYGPEFGQLIAAHALEGFLDEFGDTVSTSVGHNLKAFQGFQYRIPAIIREVSHQVLAQCERVQLCVPSSPARALLRHPLATLRYRVCWLAL